MTNIICYDKTVIRGAKTNDHDTNGDLSYDKSCDNFATQIAVLATILP